MDCFLCRTDTKLSHLKEVKCHIVECSEAAICGLCIEALSMAQSIGGELDLTGDYSSGAKDKDGNTKNTREIIIGPTGIVDMMNLFEPQKVKPEDLN